MRDIPLPENVSSEVYRAFAEIQEALHDTEIPEYRSLRELNQLPEGQSAFYQDGGKLYLYTRTRTKLHRIEYDIEPVVQQAVEAEAGRNYSSELG